MIAQRDNGAKWGTAVFLSAPRGNVIIATNETLFDIQEWELVNLDN
jgi:hypothetical protein